MCGVDSYFETKHRRVQFIKVLLRFNQIMYIIVSVCLRVYFVDGTENLWLLLYCFLPAALIIGKLGMAERIGKCPCWTGLVDYVMLFTSLFLLAELFATLDTHSCINDTCAHATTILRTVQPLARAEVEFLSFLWEEG